MTVFYFGCCFSSLNIDFITVFLHCLNSRIVNWKMYLQGPRAGPEGGAQPWLGTSGNWGALPLWYHSTGNILFKISRWHSILVKSFSISKHSWIQKIYLRVQATWPAGQSSTYPSNWYVFLIFRRWTTWLTSALPSTCTGWTGPRRHTQWAGTDQATIVYPYVCFAILMG